MKRVVTTFLITMLICVGVSIFPVIAEKSDIQLNTQSVAYAADTDFRYGQTQHENSAQKHMYKAIRDAVKAGKTTASFNYRKYKTYVKDFEIAQYAFWRDYPEYAYFEYYESTYASVGYGNTARVAKMNISYNKTLKAKKNEYEARANAIVKSIPKEFTTDYARAKYLYETLIGINEYDDVSFDSGKYHYKAQTAYGPLIYGTSVCEGYAKAYHDLLRRAGIKAWTVYGFARLSDDEELNEKFNLIYRKGHYWAGHAWNVFWLDGKCYYSDPTADDEGSTTPFAYFCQPLDDFNEHHYIKDCSGGSAVVNNFQNKCFKKCGHEQINDPDCAMTFENEFTTKSLDMLKPYLGPTTTGTWVEEPEKEFYVRSVRFRYTGGKEIGKWYNDTINAGYDIFKDTGLSGNGYVPLIGTGEYYTLYLYAEKTTNEVVERVLDRPIAAAIKNSSKRQITLKWYKVDSADSYEIYRKVGRDGEYEFFKTTKNHSFTDTKLTKGHTYYYKVKALSDDGAVSDFSVTASATLK